MEPTAATRRPYRSSPSGALPSPPSGTIRLAAKIAGHRSSRLRCPSSGRTSGRVATCSLGRDARDGGSSAANGGATSLRPPVPAGAEATPPLLTPSSNEGLVFDVGAAGAWDGREVGSPVVKRYVGDESERWFLWYHGCGDGDGSGDCIGLATSANGMHWKRDETVDGESAGLVVGRSGDWWAFDTAALRPAEVISMSSAKVSSPGAFYWLYYTGYIAEKVDMPATAALKSLPGLAISQDGCHWARIEGEHHTGALLDVGEAGEWDSLFLAAPRVVYHEAGDLRMYYHSFDRQSRQFAIGVARSRDGITWAKLGRVMGGGPAGAFDEAGVMCGHVVRMGKEGQGYLMAYEGVSGDGRRSIGVAESPDGLKDWRRRGGEAVLEPSAEGGWDDGGVGSPCLVQMDGEGWRLYYGGVGKGGRSGIGMALSDGPEMRSFKRCGGGCFSL
ncbi:unnamed protein product [Spirodela intermedia]|uniref:Uncharacterized protein n=1 Tax=Spirodela intermedia TaxID=51605 RepID=A0A7I8KUG4_SPIIN|nr:unnamed protein product [Spirodela intermedia]